MDDEGVVAVGEMAVANLMIRNNPSNLENLAAWVDDVDMKAGWEGEVAVDKDVGAVAKNVAPAQMSSETAAVVDSEALESFFWGETPPLWRKATNYAVVFAVA